ncbi:hypothetical protein [Hoyosella altamirensis]|uniref:ABC-type transporter Mla subunit MlaD n=1 Tax=Hoyosella altamirensis TaxID=616997 RepID=A0A839RKZ7_9ACTN|nr:hypothetical protein [Hoyosella altamirensis]MBB3036661.1 ABC-type transporter Mla subunit MlaD [Hoyosella altamirensis]
MTPADENQGRQPGKVRRLTHVVLSLDETMDQANGLMKQADTLLPELVYQLQYLNDTLTNINTTLERANGLLDNADWMLSPAQSIRKRLTPRPNRSTSKGSKRTASQQDDLPEEAEPVAEE